MAVGVVALPSLTSKFFRGVKDSKKLSEAQRFYWFSKITSIKSIRWSVAFSSSKTIDKIGIVKAVQLALNKALQKLSIYPRSAKILLDGGLGAPFKYKKQRTIVRGDETEISIALASIIAKIHRDQLMKKFAKHYPKYQFQAHKGYGTKKHRKLIKKYGVTPIHRRSFLKNLQSV